MKVTNNLHLPEALVEAVSIDRHNEPDHYSATTLNKGTKEIMLMNRHFDELTVDAADNIWAVWGTAVHAIMEAHKDDCFHEEPFSVPVSKSTVTGKVDSYDMEHGVINDWKTASLWKVQLHDFADWTQQGLTYAWLLTQNGLVVNKCRFIAILKDHSKSKARMDKEYPQSPVYCYEFNVTPEDLQRTGARILAKVREIEAATSLSDDAIAPCSDEERWSDPAKWAVMKRGVKKAFRVFDKQPDAESLAAQMGAGYTVQHRAGIDRKCADYCTCKDFCNYYREHSQQGE